MWVKIKRLENSPYGNAKLGYFDFYDKEKFIVITQKVLSYVNKPQLNQNDEIFVIKSFRDNKEFFLLKAVK